MAWRLGDFGALLYTTQASGRSAHLRVRDGAQEKGARIPLGESESLMLVTIITPL